MVAKLEQEFGGGGEVKGPKFWCLRVRWSPFFPGFKTEDCCLPVSASGNPTRGDKVREGCCNLSPSIKASLLCTQACNISVCILETSEYFAQSCREGYKHLGNPQPPPPPPKYNYLLCSLWGSHLSQWEKEHTLENGLTRICWNILTAFTFLTQSLQLGASLWPLCSLTGNAVWIKWNGKMLLVYSYFTVGKTEYKSMRRSSVKRSWWKATPLYRATVFNTS